MKMLNLNEIVFDKKKIALVLIIFLAVVYADIALFMQWQIGMIKASGPQISQLKTDIDALNSDIARMEQEKKQQDLERKLSKEKPRKIPDSAQIPQVLSKISDLANRNSIKIMQISTNKNKQGSEKPGVPEPYNAVFVAADLVGEYHQLGAFLNDLDEMDEVVTVTDFKVFPNPDNMQNQVITIIIKVYVDK